MAGKHRADTSKIQAHATLGHDITQPTSSARESLSTDQMPKHAAPTSRDVRGYNPSHQAAPGPAQLAPKTMGPQHEAHGKRPDSKPYASTKPGKHRQPSSEQNVTSGDRGKHAKTYSIQKDLASVHDKHKSEYVGKHSDRGMPKKGKLDGAKVRNVIKKTHAKLTSKHSGKNKAHLGALTK